ncbi:branched-chain amino acid transport system ATP-binding protein [Variovorax sp. HW608]|nr:branched-chain amino acid transport system ATP-binding protein [Variovorax sp. HW608]
MSGWLTVENLHAAYGNTRVINGMSFSLNKGSIMALLGANGSGKTTTLRALCGMRVRASGTIQLDGAELINRRTAEIVRLGVAHVPDGRGTFAHLTTEENLHLGAYTRRDTAAVAADIERMYSHFPRLKERRSQHAGTLSGGEQQMLAIARALMLRPRLLLLDEPSFGLAPMVVRDIFAILRQINVSDGVAILLVEQNASLALELADQACLLETGRLVLSGSAEDLKKDDTIRRAYLGY